MKKISGMVVIGLLAMFIGLVISIQITTTQGSDQGGLVPLAKAQAYETELKKVRAEKEVATQELQKLEDRMDKIEQEKADEDFFLKGVVTDLDGTLLKNDKTISKNTIEAINELRMRGHKFVIATARPLRAAKKFLESVETDAGIYHNGALIYKLGEKMDGFQIDSVKKLVDQVLNKYPKASIAVESDDVLYSNFNVEHLWPGTDYIITAADFAELEGKKADKVIIEVSSMEDMERYKEFLSDDLYIQLSENKIGMIMKKNATKSNGIIFLAQSYGINIDDVICFGDDYNDIDMLTLCGTGICMANGVQKAKDAADVLCDTNENDGVAKWIKENILSNQQ